MRIIAEQIFLAGVESVLPDTLIRSQLKCEEGRLVIAGSSVSLPRHGHLYLLAAGKAASLMAKAAEEILSDHITEGQVVTKYGHSLPPGRLTVAEAGHPLPDAAGVEATRRMLSIAQKAEADDRVLCLLSGGASSLMADLPEGCSLAEVILGNDLLVRCGADISEINTVRKHLSAVKGGQLAAAAAPATVISLILSDVVGDDPGVIASGPTAPDESTFADALDVISRYALEERFPEPLMRHLHRGAEGLLPETPKPGAPLFRNVHNRIIGSNRLALEGAARRAIELGFAARIITDTLQGNYTEAADYILRTISDYQSTERLRPLCLLFGGEPTLQVSGNGVGGRNQHLALWLATKIDSSSGITLLCAGTDGTDGPTHAAGAVVDGRTLSDAQQKKIDAGDHLSRYDSFHFFQKAGGHIITGNTRTNVMDMVVVLLS
ncbi:MAG: glycerate kinase [Proteiniphilum sp.]|nr:glycerate kinase [Proteiniphilum sp.]